MNSLCKHSNRYFELEKICKHLQAGLCNACIIDLLSLSSKRTAVTELFTSLPSGRTDCGGGP